MANKILHKRSSTASNVPTAGQLDYGEIAINTADGKLFIKKSDNSIVEVGAGGGGLSNIVEDTTPQLGGDLDGQTFRITNISDPSSGQDAATRSWTLAQIAAYDMVTDTSPQLGGNLDVNDYEIVSTNGGDIVINPDSPGVIQLGGDLDLNGNKIFNVSGTVELDDGLTIETAYPSIDLKDTDSTANVRFTRLVHNTDQFRIVSYNDAASVINENYNILKDSNGATEHRFFIGATQAVVIESDGTMSVNTASYETLVTDDDDIPNKKYVDDAAGGNEGTFTPVVADATTGGNTATVTSANGYYTKIGKTVYFEIEIKGIVTTSLTGSNAIYIRDLPFTAANTIDVVVDCACEEVDERANGDTMSINGMVIKNTSYMSLPQTNRAALFELTQVNDLTSGDANLYLSGHYRTA